MRIYTASLLVDDVARAHDFYVNTLGFKVKDDDTVGNLIKWCNSSFSVAVSGGQCRNDLKIVHKREPVFLDWSA